MNCFAADFVSLLRYISIGDRPLLFALCPLRGSNWGQSFGKQGLTPSTTNQVSSIVVLSFDASGRFVLVAVAVICLVVGDFIF